MPPAREAAFGHHLRDELEFQPPAYRRAGERGKSVDANVRINPVKPIEPEHMSIALPADMYFRGFSRLMELCTPVDLGEPPLAAVTDYQHARRCPCGRTSFRIHSIAPDGAIYVSPCVYLHDFKVPLDLLERDLIDIIHSLSFASSANGTTTLAWSMAAPTARGWRHAGVAAWRDRICTICTSRATRPCWLAIPIAPFACSPVPTFRISQDSTLSERLVHMDYLCTWIGKPRR